MTAGELFGLAACAVCAAALGAVVKRSSREHALLLAAVTAVLLLLAALEGADPLLRELEGLSAAFPGECFPVMLKAVGITIAGQLAADGLGVLVQQSLEVGRKLCLHLLAFDKGDGILFAINIDVVNVGLIACGVIVFVFLSCFFPF